MLVQQGPWPCLGQSSLGPGVVAWSEDQHESPSSPLQASLTSGALLIPNGHGVCAQVCWAPWWKDMAPPSRCSQPRAEANGWLKYSGTCCHPGQPRTLCSLHPFHPSPFVDLSPRHFHQRKSICYFLFKICCFPPHFSSLLLGTLTTA